MKHVFGAELPLRAWADEEGVDDEAIRERLTAATDEQMAAKVARYGAETMRSIEKQVLLQTIDSNWREHLVTLDHLRSVVGFRGYAQRDPLNEYKSEAFQLFESAADPAALRGHPHARARAGDDPGGAAGDAGRAPGPRRRPRPPASPRPPSRPPPPRIPAMAGAAAPALRPGVDPADPATWGLSGRNDPCPCGSGKKYKHCHGRV